MSKKISIDQIATWRAGELMTERKLQEVFTLIGEVINLHALDLDDMVETLSKVNVATRWLAIVDNYSDIQVWIENNKNDEQFNPPIPHRGDIFMVNNNSDDPNIPVGLNPGRYLYIYNYNPIDDTGSWNIYNPFALVNATTQNDGLMSKEAFTKLNDLPTNQKLTEDLTTINNSISSINSNLDTLNPQVELNKSDIDNLKTRANSLEQNKQNKRTDTSGSLLKGYKTSTVEDNLVEVKELVDTTLKQDIMIWEPDSETDKQTTGEISNQSVSVEIPFDNLTLENNTFIRLYFQATYDKVGAEIPVKTFSTTGRVLEQQNVLQEKTYKVVFEPCIFNIVDNTVSGNADILVAYIRDANDDYTLKFVINNIPAEFDGSNIIITPLKIIKDIGVSDYMWSEGLKQDIKEFLKNNLGIRKQLVTSNNRPDNFNGFRAGDEFTLKYSYVINSNSIEVFQGGVKLTQGVEFEELQISDPLYSNKIKFLKDVDISKDGELEIVGQAIVVNTIQLRIWNANEQFVVGNVVLHKGDAWYCNINNVGQEPVRGGAYWTLMKQEFDIEKITKEIKDYINEVSTGIIDDILQNKQNGASLVWPKDSTQIFPQYQEYLTSIGTLVSLKAYTLTDDNQKSYVQLSGNNEQGEPIGTNTPTTIGSEGYAFVKINKNVYVDNLANVNVLTATPNEVRQEVKAEFGNYTNKLITGFKEEVLNFKNQTDYEAFRDRNFLTDNDFEDVDTSDVGVQLDLTLKKEGDNELANYSQLSINSKNDLVIKNPNGKVGITMNDKETPDYLLTEQKANVEYGTKITQLQSDTSSLETKVQQLEGQVSQTQVSLQRDNIFTGNNTFKQIKVKGTNNNNNYVLLDNFDWQNKNYSAVKLVKNNTENLLQVEANNNNSEVNISAPTASAFYISNLSNPTQANQAANKQYVDNVIKQLTINISAMGTKQEFSNGGMRYIVKNYDLWTNHRVGYTQVIGVSWVNKTGKNSVITGYCVFDNSWIEVQFLDANSASVFQPSGHIYVWYK